MFRNFRQKRVLAGVGSVLGISYYVSHLEKVPGSNRTRFMNVSPEQEINMSNEAYNEIVQSNRKKLLPQYHTQSLIVQQVADRLIQASTLEGVDWKVQVIQSEEANAFVLANGSIFVYTGILKLTQNKDQLATVLAHEISHVSARHSGEKLSFLNLAMGVKFLVSVFVGYDVAEVIFSPLVFQIGFNLPFSRRCEEEADSLGLALMAKACFDPRESLPFWERMGEQGQKVPQFISTHPDPLNRVKKLKTQMPDAVRIYDENCGQVREFFKL